MIIQEEVHLLPAGSHEVASSQACSVALAFANIKSAVLSTSVVTQFCLLLCIRHAGKGDKAVQLASGPGGGMGSGKLARQGRTEPFRSGTFPTQSGCVRVPQVGACADKRFAWPSLIRDKNRMR